MQESETKTATDIEQLWERALTEIELSVSKANFTTWFKNTCVLKEEEGVIHISVPNGFVKEWLQGKYHKFILKSLRNVSPYVRGVDYVIVPRGEKYTEKQEKERGVPSYTNELPLKDLYVNKEDNLNPRYTFDSFVVGPFNEVAYAAARSIIESPGHSYNPLFVYGGTGLGKTHLLQATGNKIKETAKDKRVFYVTAERFYLDFVNAVGANKVGTFKEKYRKYDVLIMDDVQFLTGKQSTQDELFHLFNELYDKNKQIIFSSDKHPNYIGTLEDRLRSRFGAGMIIDIQDPNFESKVAILQSKSKNIDFCPSPEIIDHVANTARGSIRELEGVLNVIVCQAQLKKRNLTINEVKSLIKNSEKPRKSLSVDDVVGIVSGFYNIEKGVIYEKTRRKEVVRPRQIIMFLLREDFGISFPTIGQKLGGRDHTTVIHSCEKVKRDIAMDVVLSQDLEQIRSMF
ncbi:MAG: chromosomal replication initiator protein DnaA [Parcubacteria group bacterium]|nr:chromosomal replication initiator protein DnaA [Parcubacteria group bacterium]